MTGHSFLSLAMRLSAAGSEVEQRTPLSRASYAVFQVARQLFEDLGFAPPVDEGAHKHLAGRLSNCGNPLVVRAGSQIDILRGFRNRAEYDLWRSLSAHIVSQQLQAPELILPTLDSLTPPRHPCWRDAKQEYEAGLAEFEKGNFRQAARILANLRGKCPNDGPASSLLFRAASGMVQEPAPVDVVWELPGK